MTTERDELVAMIGLLSDDEVQGVIEFVVSLRANADGYGRKAWLEEEVIV